MKINAMHIFIILACSTPLNNLFFSTKVLLIEGQPSVVMPGLYLAVMQLAKCFLSEGNGMSCNLCHEKALMI
jgi:hypothetical protein